jgi:hypothetical protein
MNRLGLGFLSSFFAKSPILEVRQTVFINALTGLFLAFSSSKQTLPQFTPSSA